MPCSSEILIRTLALVLRYRLRVIEISTVAIIERDNTSLPITISTLTRILRYDVLCIVLIRRGIRDVL